jgi:hypothetical protein
LKILNLLEKNNSSFKFDKQFSTSLQTLITFKNNKINLFSEYKTSTNAFISNQVDYSFIMFLILDILFCIFIYYFKSKIKKLIILYLKFIWNLFF